MEKKEPIRNGKLWVIFGLIFLAGVPWYLPAGSYKPLIWGIPYWVWIVFSASLALSLFLTYVLKREWRMEEAEQETEEGS